MLQNLLSIHGIALSRVHMPYSKKTVDLKANQLILKSNGASLMEAQQESKVSRIPKISQTENERLWTED